MVRWILAHPPRRPDHRTLTGRLQVTNTTAAAVDLVGWRLYDCYASGGKPSIGPRAVASNSATAKAKRVEEIRDVHFDNDYYQRDETSSPTGVSDHDPPVVRIAIPRGGLG
jgi:hypothetical protein